MRKLYSFFLFLLIVEIAHSQNTVTGSFPTLANQHIKLVGFEGFTIYTIDSVMASTEGVFNLSYAKNDWGMGYLVANDEKPFFVVLNGENVKLSGDAFALPQTIQVVESLENKLLEEYASEHPRREQALSAWVYLEKLYASDPLFAIQQVPRQAIKAEQRRLKTADSLYLAGLPDNSYVRWYLPLRKLVSSVSTIAQYRTEEIPTAITAFRRLDYTDPRWYKSGLLADAIESHFWLIENSGRPLDSVYTEMETSIDCLLNNLSSDEQKLNEITGYLFKVLEKRSLFTASEYLALKLLNETSCTLTDDFAAQLESYRAMKKGNIAPDIEFAGDVLAPGYTNEILPQKLSDIESDYTAVIFGASWCPACPSELMQINRLYQKWKKYNIEVVFVSLDEEAQLFKNFVGIFPFISMCDYKKWESPVVKEYDVFASPTIYLLNNKREILLRPNSVSQLDAWVDWYLVQGNK